MRIVSDRLDMLGQTEQNDRKQYWAKHDKADNDTDRQPIHRAQRRQHHRHTHTADRSSAHPTSHSPTGRHERLGEVPTEVCRYMGRADPFEAV